MPELQETAGTAGHVPYFATKGEYPGIPGWILSTDHKRIGILYLVSILTFFSGATVLGVLMRINMLHGIDIVTAHKYNAMFTLHWIILIFLFVIPAVPTIFGNIVTTVHRFRTPGMGFSRCRPRSGDYTFSAFLPYLTGEFIE